MAISKELSSRKLSQRVCELLKNDILECRLEPGQLPEENAINARSQIDRTPFRETCQRVAAVGLVEIVPHRGAFVASFSLRDISDLFELRMVVEPAVAELASQRFTAGQLDALDANIAEWKALTASTGPTRVPEIDWNSKNFHVGVARLTQNRELVNAVESMHDKLMRVIIFTARRSPRNYPFDAIHRELLLAIRSGNASDARSLTSRSRKSMERPIE